MSKIKDQVYTIAAIDTLIGGKSSTDLGGHTLEYQTELSNTFIGSNEESFACLTILVRLRNNETKKLEYANVFNKVLSKLHSAYSEETSKIHNKLISASIEEKMAFILKPETFFLRKPYAKSSTVASYDFLKEFTYLDGYDYPSVSLDGKIPADAQVEIEEYYRNVLESTKEQIKEKNQNK